jgi:methyl-accepting chemotaxis protein
VADVAGVRLETLWQAPAAVVDALLEAARTRQYLEQTLSITDGGGRQRWLRVNCEPVDVDGAPAGRGKSAPEVQQVLLTAYDITEDRRQLGEFKGKFAAVDRSQAVSRTCTRSSRSSPCDRRHWTVPCAGA